MGTNMALPRIVFLSPSPIVGPELYADALRRRNFCEALAKRGFRVSIVGLDSAIPKLGARSETKTLPARRRPFRVFLMRLLSTGPASTAIVLLRALALTAQSSAQHDTIVVYNGGWLVFTAQLLKAFRRGTRIHLDLMGMAPQEARLARYRFWKFKTKVFEIMLRSAVKSADVVTTINHAHAEAISKQYGREPLVVPDLLDSRKLDEFLALPLPEPSLHATVFFMGSLSRHRLDSFLEAVKRLREHGSAFRVVVAGGGRDLNEYRSAYESPGVTFTGFVDEVKLMELLASSDICYSDIWTLIGTPYNIIEYMAAGRAIVTHRTASLEDLLTDRVDALMCPASVDGIEGALHSLLTNPAMRVALGLEARRKIRQLHRFETGAALEAAYRRDD